jgi:hypothetical protein
LIVILIFIIHVSIDVLLFDYHVIKLIHYLVNRNLVSIFYTSCSRLFGGSASL